MNSWFECKVNYDKAGEDGLLTRVNELYLVDAMSFTEAEERIIREIEPMLTGEFVVASIKKVKINELIDSDIDTDDRWWKCRVMLISIDEEKGVEKTIATLSYVKAATLNGAVEYLASFMEKSVYPYRIVSVSETPILDIFNYQITNETHQKNV